MTSSSIANHTNQEGNTVFRYYRWLYRQYNKVGVTAGNKVLVRQDNGSYTPAKAKGQIIGNVVITAYLSLVMYGCYKLGKNEGEQSGYEEALEDMATKLEDKNTSSVY